MQVENIQEACDFCGYDLATIHPDVSAYPEKHREALLAVAELFIIHEAYNDRRVPDWNDIRQRKYFPWWNMETDKNNPSGFRFDGTYYGITSAGANGGSRLCLLNSEDITHSIEYHIELYRKINVIGKK